MAKFVSLINEPSLAATVIAMPHSGPRLSLRQQNRIVSIDPDEVPPFAIAAPQPLEALHRRKIELVTKN
jgi:hypothetical protein